MAYLPTTQFPSGKKKSGNTARPNPFDTGAPGTTQQDDLQQALTGKIERQFSPFRTTSLAPGAAPSMPYAPPNRSPPGEIPFGPAGAPSNTGAIRPEDVAAARNRPGDVAGKAWEPEKREPGTAGTMPGAGA